MESYILARCYYIVYGMDRRPWKKDCVEGWMSGATDPDSCVGLAPECIGRPAAGCSSRPTVNSRWRLSTVKALRTLTLQPLTTPDQRQIDERRRSVAPLYTQRHTCRIP